MKGADLIRQLKTKFRVTTDSALAAKLGITVPGVQLWKKRPNVTVAQVASLAHRASKGGGFSGDDLIHQLKKKFRVTTDDALASQLGITIHGVQLWKSRPSVTIRQIASLAHGASEGGAAILQRKAIQPVVEFYPIEACSSTQGKTVELFDPNDENGKPHPYRSGLRDELRNHYGVYIFFDSRGQAIYAGKARKQKLWTEMKLAFNRGRGDVQSIKRVKHPERKLAYKTSEEKHRRLRDYIVPLYELAAYFSAYEVEDGLINTTEAMLVRSFANDLLNVRMERFGERKKKSKKKKQRKGPAK